jgi:hypothetical protein
VLLNDTTTKLDSAMNDLESKKEELKKLMEEMRFLEKKLIEQQFLTNAHAATEERLAVVATDLADNLISSIQDIDGLYEKIGNLYFNENENKMLREIM